MIKPLTFLKLLDEKHVVRNMLAPSAGAFMQHIPYARVRIHSGAFFCLIGNSGEFPIKQKNALKVRASKAS